MKKTIHVFGNPLLDFDNLPIKLLPELKKEFPKFNFIHLDPNENIKPINKELIIIDTVINIDKVKIFDDIDSIELNNIYTAHDLDLGFNIKLLQKINKLDKIIIFGIPPKLKKDTALKQLIKEIKKQFN